MVLLVSCENELKEEVFDNITPSNFFQNDVEAVSSVYSVYSSMIGTGWSYYGSGTERIQAITEGTTDILKSTGSSGLWWEMNELILKPENGSVNQLWNDMYRGIAASNYILEFLPPAENVSDAVKKNVLAEAKTGLGLFYKDLVEMWGDAPIIRSYNEGLTSEPSRDPKTEVLTYAIELLEAAIPDLPDSYPTDQYGRFTKGAARGILMKIALIQKDWIKVNEYTDAIINSSNYSLNPSYGDLFAVDNTNESEFVLVNAKFPDWLVGNSYQTYSTPGDFDTQGSPVQKWNAYRIQRDFYDTFDAEDIRRSFIVTEYINESGDLVTLTPAEGAISIKYAFDPAGVVVFSGNDTPLIRLADVLLAKAEALNEINGPNQVSIDLINQIRDRAFDNNPAKRVALSDFASKAELNAHILNERGWELFFEGHRRVDLIRHGEFINKAVARGATVTESTRVLFPLTTGATDTNPNLLPNNPGY